ncbi:MAG TPA: 3-hydroxyacyl-CoA dehydrogenase [Candidimonas sp.]|nr:3-hydroxyacyl-CoA dehydrogenase [Candidimonas sp.]
MKIAVIGAGLIGQAWAIVFARGGCDVQLWDGDQDALASAMGLIAGQMRQLESKGLLVGASAATAHIQAMPTLEQALAGVGYVQENLPERIDIKKSIYKQMDALCAPETILASSTSSIPASAFTEDLPGRHRCLVAHPVNPPYLIPVVELCGAPWTDTKAIEKARKIMQSVGQKPVTVHKEVEGFVLNRLQGALLREAFRLVQSGCISVEDLDVTVKDGLGLRWSFMGPFETIDLNAPDGLQDYCNRYGGMYQSISQEQVSTDSWSNELVADVEAQRRALLSKDELLKRRLWRDERLMGLLLHKSVSESNDAN